MSAMLVRLSASHLQLPHKQIQEKSAIDMWGWGWRYSAGTDALRVGVPNTFETVQTSGVRC